MSPTACSNDANLPSCSVSFSASASSVFFVSACSARVSDDFLPVRSVMVSVLPSSEAFTFSAAVAASVACWVAVSACVADVLALSVAAFASVTALLALVVAVVAVAAASWAAFEALSALAVAAVAVATASFTFLMASAMSMHLSQ